MCVPHRTAPYRNRDAWHIRATLFPAQQPYSNHLRTTSGWDSLRSSHPCYGRGIRYTEDRWYAAQFFAP
jgi:hypothetical protein